MKHETILVPVKCSPETNPKKSDWYWTDMGPLCYKKTQYSTLSPGQWLTDKNEIVYPDEYFEEQHDKIVLSEEEYEQLKIQSLKLPKTHLKTPWSK